MFETDRRLTKNHLYRRRIMAKANSTGTTLFGVTYSPTATFGPTLLRRIYGATLPSHFVCDHRGAVLVSVVAADIIQSGVIGLARMHAESDIVIPGSPDALDEF